VYESKEIAKTICAAVVLSYIEELYNINYFSEETIPFYKLFNLEKSPNELITSIEEIEEKLRGYTKKKVEIGKMLNKVKKGVLVFIEKALKDNCNFNLNEDYDSVKDLIAKLVMILSCSVTVLKRKKKSIFISSEKRGAYFPKLTFYEIDTSIIYIPLATKDNSSLLTNIQSGLKDNMKREIEQEKCKY